MDFVKSEEIEGESARARMRRLYKLGDVLGQGAFSAVRLATHKPTNRDFAVKVIDRTSSAITEEDDQLIEQEVKIVSSLRHPNIIRLVEYMTSTNFYYIVLEYCPGGELFDEIAKRSCYSEVDARDIIRIVCDAICYCHSNGIVHRDLKPENLLLSSSDPSLAEIKISDFGMSAMASDSSLVEFCGTPEYMAPELINRQPYGAAVDMWAIGVITYCLLGGYPPFQDESEPALFSQICAANFEFHEDSWGGVSDIAKDFIRHLLVVDPENRYTAKQALAHEWLHEESRTALSDNDLAFSLKKIRAHAAKKKFKAAGKAVLAAQRMARLMGAFDPAGPDDEILETSAIEINVGSASGVARGVDNETSESATKQPEQSTTSSDVLESDRAEDNPGDSDDGN